MIVEPCCCSARRLIGIFLADSAAAITGWLILAGLATGQISVNIFAVGADVRRRATQAAAGSVYRTR